MMTDENQKDKQVASEETEGTQEEDAEKEEKDQ